MRRLVLVSSLLLSCGVFVGGAFADTRDPVAADALFREARALLLEKKYAEACPKLAESFRLDPVAGTLFNLADCEEKQGHLATAMLRWQALVDLLTASKKLTDPRLPAGRKKVEDLGARVPKLALQMKPGITIDTVVYRDGVELRGASLGAALPVDPGEHIALVRAPYRRDREFKITLLEGESKTVELEPGEPDGTEPKPPASAAASSAPPVESAPPAHSAPVASAPVSPPSETSPVLPAAGGWQRPVGLAVGGVGVASLIGAGVTGVLLNGYKDKVEQDCSRQSKQCSTQEGTDAASSGKTLAPINLALWIVGAAGVGAGAYLFFTAPKESSVQPGVSFSKEQSGVWLQGRF